MRGDGRPTLHEVATLAGVSMGTASSAFTRRQPVARQTRDAVLKAADVLGYHPRGRAAPLGRPVTALALLTGSAASPPVLPDPVHIGARKAAAELGATLVVGAAGDVLGRWVVRRDRPQGALLVGNADPRLARRLREAGVPCVMIQHSGIDQATDAVRPHDRRAAFLATDHLLRLGHTAPPPALVLGRDGAAVDQLAGHRSALRQHQRDGHADHLRLSATSTIADGRAAADALFALVRPPSAVVCGSVALARGVLAALAAGGVAVPGAVSVVALDGLAGRVPDPSDEPDAVVGRETPGPQPLTVVGADRLLLGAEGIRHLAQRVRQPDLPRRVTLVDVALRAAAATAGSR
ncbi:LacI family DNA-binding transcriptional regulator [Micromonospora sp. 067-2]|uniref:LacI family DNA-binding transcriptional regulator n=1 Tax=Micromonospora sp. 067-2 TaxID=2789270 RepID=UPI00397E073F